MARPRRAKITDPDLARVIALADPSRWAMMRLLAERPRSVGEMAEAMGLSLAVTSRHLQRMRAAGIVAAERHGKNLVCALAGPDSEGGQWLAAAFGVRARGPGFAARAGSPPGERVGSPAAERAGSPPVGDAAGSLPRRPAPGRPSAERRPPERLPKREMDDFLL